jgi:N-acetylglucosamine-6-phosphate deacetylase
MTVLGHARVVTPRGILDPGWIRVEANRIAEVGSGGPPVGAGTLDLEGSWVVPGFFDLHVHGGGGASMTTGDPAEVLAAACYHRRHGTTRTLASQVTAPLVDMRAGAAAVAELVEGEAEDGLVVGCHLEGPFLSRSRCGALDPDSMLEPDPDTMRTLLDAGRGGVRMVTLAPELPGGIDLIGQVIGAGAVAAVGHSDATYEQALAATTAGARVATHLFNAMRGLHHREPGVAGAALDRPEVVCEVINDGFHLADPIVRLVFTAARGRVALVTDAIVAAGAPDGEYALGGLRVLVGEGRATLVGGDAIAGSTLTMDRAFQRAMRLGLPIEAVVHAASTTPARVLGLADRLGSLEAGRLADLCVLDGEFHLLGVMAGGGWVGEAGRGSFG